jgi:hypothetical protein
MEVHPPHERLHSWKDFWIHLGTITIGLLIALGLEAGVEQIHHVEQRHQLEEELHEEALKNQAILEQDLKSFDERRRWLISLRHDVDAMRASKGKLKVPFSADSNHAYNIMPSDTVWASARESGRLSLLPQKEAEMYSDLYLQYVWLKDAGSEWFAKQNERRAFENRFDDASPSSTPDLSRMTMAELDRYSDLLTEELTRRDHVVDLLRFYQAENKALLSGAKSESDLHTKMNGAAEHVEDEDGMHPEP